MRDVFEKKIMSQREMWRKSSGFASYYKINQPTGENLLNKDKMRVCKQSTETDVVCRPTNWNFGSSSSSSSIYN